MHDAGSLIVVRGLDELGYPPGIFTGVSVWSGHTRVNIEQYNATNFGCVATEEL